MKKTVKLGLVGYGTVGQGVMSIMENNRRAIEQKVGAAVEIAAVCDKRKLSIKGTSYTSRYQDLLESPDIDIIVELIGGYEPARTLILESLKSGKNVVTANKAVLAKYWDEVFGAVRQYRRLVYFEAAVGGGIPVVQGLNEGLAANRIEKISGILNGTTNYILSEMTHRKIGFKKALISAQKAGFAEADPTFDIEGIDTAHKLAVLASLAWSSWIRIEDIATTGISNVSAEDISFAGEEFGYVMKLIGSAKAVGNTIDLSVQPCLIAKNHPFSNVEKEYNAVFIHGDAVGDVMFYGKGAGQLPAASAVVSDILCLSREVVNGTAGKMPYVTYDPSKKIKILSADKREGCYYLRFNTLDRPGVLSKIAGVLSRYNVSIASVFQKESLANTRGGASIIMLTHRINHGNLARALEHIDRMPFARANTVQFKIED